MRLNDNVMVQFCLAHLIRDVKFLVNHFNSENRAYGRRVLETIRSLFDVIHGHEEMTEAGFSRRRSQLAKHSNIKPPIVFQRSKDRKT